MRAIGTRLSASPVRTYRCRLVLLRDGQPTPISKPPGCKTLIFDRGDDRSGAGNQGSLEWLFLPQSRRSRVAC
jgi:hypothetical protein